MDKAIRQEHDAYELCQLPMASLSKLPKTVRSLRFESGKCAWTIEAHPEHGLPGPGDMEVYMLMLALTAEAGMAKKVSFSPAVALGRLGWADNAERYGRLRLALVRWQETTYIQEGLIRFKVETDLKWDRLKVLQHVSFTKRGRALWSFTWTDHLHYLLLQTFHRVHVDVALYLSLKSPVARAVYRYLLARCWDRTAYRDGRAERLMEWARSRIGIQEPYPSKVLRHLRPALEELVTVGFLARYILEGRRLRFFFANTEPSPPPADRAPAGRKGGARRDPGPLRQELAPTIRQQIETAGCALLSDLIRAPPHNHNEDLHSDGAGGGEEMVHEVDRFRSWFEQQPNEKQQEWVKTALATWNANTRPYLEKFPQRLFDVPELRAAVIRESGWFDTEIEEGDDDA